MNAKLNNLPDVEYLSFLHADPTRSALQVFLRKSGATISDLDGLPAEHGTEEGIWINADPVPNCVVCNIGESMLLVVRRVLSS
jgi:isopenicillin N synthase-like dioxygenase